jgi:hypothetical protein
MPAEQGEINRTVVSSAWRLTSLASLSVERIERDPKPFS